MKKKKCLKYPAPDGNVALHSHNVSHERHHILDIRDNRGHVYRCVMTKDNYSTWDYIDQKWTTKMADDLDYSDADMSASEKKEIEAYAYAQKKIKAKKDQARCAKKKRQQEADFKALPEQPAGLNKWIEEQYPSFIYYKKRGSKAKVMCPCCGAKYEFRFAGRWKEEEEPVKDQRGSCEFCKKEGIWQPEGRVKNKMIKGHFWIIGKIKDGRLAATMWYYTRLSDGGYKDRIDCEESMHIIMEPGKVTKYYHIWNHYTGDNFWQNSNLRGFGAITINDGPIFPGWKKEIEESSMKYCDLSKWHNVLPCGMPDGKKTMYALIAHAKYPKTELLLKAGANKLARQLAEGYCMEINRRAARLDGFLRLDMQRAKELISIDGGSRELKVLQIEKKTGKLWTKEEREFIVRLLTYMGQNELEEILGLMSVTKWLNRVKKHQGEYHGLYETAREYKDYLLTRKELGYDMTNSVYLDPRNLREAHTAMIAERERKKTNQYVQKKLAEFPGIAERYKKLRRKYGWEDEGLLIRPAKDAEEIIMEGRILHHCVGGDTYLRKHHKGETAILFLRTDEKPDLPYITVEMKETKILQWYGEHDRKPDREMIEKWLEAYLEHLTRRGQQADTGAEEEWAS